MSIKAIDEKNLFSVIGSNDILILAASWEKKCLGLPKLMSNLRVKYILMTIYDGINKEREKNIKKMEELLFNSGKIVKIPATHENPLGNVRAILKFLRDLNIKNPQISIDISCFTRKHFLQLLHGLDLYNYLNRTSFFYTEPTDYFTYDNEPYTKGISSVKVISTFAGFNYPSRDKKLIIFLGYEGNRALALNEHLNHNITLAVIPDPPYKENWKNRTETQNRFLLSSLPKELVYYSHSLEPKSTEDLLDQLIQKDLEGYNFFVAPLGTKAQTLGIYRYYRKNKGRFSIVYANPIKYKFERAIYDPGRTFLIDNSSNWK